MGIDGIKIARFLTRMVQPTALTQIQLAEQAIADNIDYRVNDSVDECKRLIAAIDRLLIFRADSAQVGGTSGETFTRSHRALMATRNAAEEWLQHKGKTAEPMIGYVRMQKMRQ